MKIFYDNIETADNRFVGVPVRIDECCHDSMLWLFRNRLDLDTRNAILIKQDPETKRQELFPFCQFCGRQHETIVVTDSNK